MSDNELQTFGGGTDIDVYRPDQPLAPTLADTWGAEPDYLSETSPQLQPDLSPAQVEKNIDQLAGIFVSDMCGQLGHDYRHVNACIELFRQMVKNPPTGVKKAHNFNLYTYASDPYMVHVANHLHRLGASQELVTSICYWCGELERRLGVSPVGEQSPVTLSDTQNYLDSLDDKEHEAYIRRNEVARRNTEGLLRQKWGNAYHANIAATQAYLNSLPAVERDHFNQLVTGGIEALNDPTIITRLWQMATKQNHMPSGTALADEIASIEKVLREDRRRYNNSPVMQARLRVLYDARDGGR